MGRPPKTLNDDLDKFLLRMPDGMRKRIKAAAERNNRSMNAEIVATLDEVYGSDDFDFEAFMTEWMVPILKAPGEIERASLVENANGFLNDIGSDMAVSLRPKAGGEPDVILTMGDIKFVVGSATELKVP